MGDGEPGDFAESAGVGSCGEGRAQSAFDLGESAFAVPALVEVMLREPLEHLAPILRFRDRIRMPAVVDRNQRIADAQGVAAQDVEGLGVVGRVGHQAVDRRVARGLAHDRLERRRVVAGAAHSV